jgi:RNA polymerase sigma-70 factor (ECF subfamily)
VSDIELLERWRSGDDAAGEELVQRHFPSIYVFFDTKVNEGVDDLAQRTFLGCVEARDRVREGANFKAYLFGIARKQLLKYFARVRRHNRLDELGDMSLHDLEGSPSRVIAKQQEQKLLVQALRQIPIDLQIALELHYWEEMSLADIAGVLEIPVGTVKSRLFRAREIVKERILALEGSTDRAQTTIDNLERWAKSMYAAREGGDE